MHTPVSRFSHIGLAGLALGVMLAVTGCSKPNTAATQISPDDMSMGVPTAKVTVVEYASVACPICARVNHDMMPAFKTKYVDTGKVRYIYRPMMTGNEAVATAGHLLAECAGKDKFFSIVDAIMRNQDAMNQGGQPEQYVSARPVLLGIAQSAGLSEDQFDKCIKNQQGIEQLNTINQKALKDGVQATPTFFVNGKKMEIRNGDITDFDAAIQPLLKQ